MYQTPWLPELLWIRTEPLHLEVIASIVTVLVEMPATHNSRLTGLPAGKSGGLVAGE